MAISFRSTGLIGDPKRLLLDLAGLHHVSELLPLAAQRLAEGPAVALARIWLVKPPLSDDCEKCRLAAECQNRERCLHLMASAGQSLDSSLAAWERLDGAFRRFPIGIRKVGLIAKTGQSLEVADVVNDQAWAADPAWILDERIASFAGHPLVHRGEVLGVLGVFAREAPGESCFEWLRMIADHLAAAIANARARDEIESLKRRLEQENEYLREEVQQSAAFGDLIGQAPALQAVTRQIELVAPTNSAVLILGESGTGKEVVAREIHRHSHRADRPLIKVNCAAVPRELYESEFFGHAKGAFTGALRDRAGRFELADGGTLFLDEIGEIPLDLQAKLFPSRWCPSQVQLPSWLSVDSLLLLYAADAPVEGLIHSEEVHCDRRAREKTSHACSFGQGSEVVILEYHAAVINGTNEETEFFPVAGLDRIFASDPMTTVGNRLTKFVGLAG